MSGFLSYDLLESLPSSVVLLDGSGKITKVNRHFSLLFGYGDNPQLLEGRTFFELTVPADRETCQRNMNLTLAKGLTQQVEYTFLRKDGSTFPGGMSMSAAQKSSASHNVALIGIAADIAMRKNMEKEIHEAKTELEKRVIERTGELTRTNLLLRAEIIRRKEAEASLFAEKERLAVTLRSIGEGVIVCDTQSRVLIFNWGAEQITGWKRGEAEGAVLESVFQLEGLFYSENEVNNPDYFVLITRDQRRRIISKSISPVCDLEDREAGYVIVFRDMTEQIKMERQQALSKKLESIGQLAAGIAHEINTPMQYLGDNNCFLRGAFEDLWCLLQEYRELMSGEKDVSTLDELASIARTWEEERDLAYLEKEVPRALADSQQGIEQVSILVLAMKEFSHPGRKDKEPADLNKAVMDTITISRNEWKHVADVQTELLPQLPPVYCVASEINQVILNLLINAAQAFRESIPAQEVEQVQTIQAGVEPKGLIRVQTSRQGDRAKLTISDNGPGIQPDLIERLFDPFFTTKEVGRSTGQGLTIAHDIIVNKHGGTIEVESEPGRGATFTVTLPLTDDPGDNSFSGQGKDCYNYCHIENDQENHLPGWVKE